VNILIANDDGVFAPGIQALAHALRPLGRVVIVAPESERSGFSSALTLDRPLRPIEIAPDMWLTLSLIWLLVASIAGQTWVMMYSTQVQLEQHLKGV